MVNSHWSEAATLALISIWGSKTVQNAFDGTRRNGVIYGQIQSKMAELGFTFELAQITNKCKNLKRQYLEERDKQNRSGNSPTDWPFFEDMDTIFGDRPATKPAVVAGSSLISSQSAGPSCSNAIVNLDDSGVHDEEEDDDVAPVAPADKPSSSKVETSAQKRKSSAVDTTKKQVRKKRVKTDLVSEITEAFHKSNEEFRKEMIVERQKEMEARRELEREKQEREDRRMMQLHQLSTERQMKMLETLGMLLRPTVPVVQQQVPRDQHLQARMAYYQQPPRQSHTWQQTQQAHQHSQEHHTHLPFQRQPPYQPLHEEARQKMPSEHCQEPVNQSPRQPDDDVLHQPWF